MKRLAHVAGFLLYFVSSALAGETGQDMVQGITGVPIGFENVKICVAPAAYVDVVCVVDGDCVGGGAGSCLNRLIQKGENWIPGSAIRQTGQIACAGTSTAVTVDTICTGNGTPQACCSAAGVGTCWLPCLQLRVTNPLGNDPAYVGYSGVTTSTGNTLPGGTYDFQMIPDISRNCDSVNILCTSGQHVEVASP